jgi:hypothetical protein
VALEQAPPPQKHTQTRWHKHVGPPPIACFALHFLTSCLQFQPESINTVYDFAKFHFDCGNYEFAAELLYHFRVLVRVFLMMSSICSEMNA